MFLTRVGTNWFFLTPYGTTVSVKATRMAQARRRYLRMMGKWYGLPQKVSIPN